MALPTLKVQLDGPTGRDARVWINGHDISDGVEELDFAFSEGSVNRATIALRLDGIELDAQSLALLTAHVQITERAAAPEPDEPRCFGEEPAHAV